MAYGYRRRYRYRRYRPRRYVRRWFRRRMRRFVNGSSKSSVRVKVPITKTFSVSAVTSNGAVFAQPIYPWQYGATTTMFSACNSPLYQLYCNLYDEVKCIGCKVVLSIGTPIGTSSVPSATFVTAWDRRLSLPEISGAKPTFSDLLNYASQQKATAVNNSIAKLRRSCYASDLLEKAQWHDCSLEEGPNDTMGDPALHAAGANPNFFAPGMWIGVSQTGATAQTISMQADVIWYFAFRNPKYGAASSSKGVESRSLPVMADMEHEDLADDEEMDEADELVDDILDMGANMSKNAAEGAAQRRAILKARRQQAKDRVPVTKTI